MTEFARKPIISPITYRIIGIQILFFGLLFLPEMSLYPLKFQVAEFSMVMKTFQEIVDNPWFYALLMLVTVIMLFSFSVHVEEVSNSFGQVSLGLLVSKALTRILIIYVILFTLSWLFLVYKLRFMGDIYINNFIVT